MPVRHHYNAPVRWRLDFQAEYWCWILSLSTAFSPNLDVFPHSMWALIYSIYSHNLFVASFKCKRPREVWKTDMTAPLKSLRWHCTGAPLIFAAQTRRSQQQTCGYLECFELLWSVYCSDTTVCFPVLLLSLTVERSSRVRGRTLI